LRTIAVVAALAAGLSAASAAGGQVPESNVAANAHRATPAEGAYRLPPGKLVQAIELSRARLWIHFGVEIWQVAFLVLLLVTKGAERIADWSGRRSRKSWVQAAIFSAVIAALIFVAVDLPAAAIGHAFSLRYQVSVEEWPAWIADVAKSLGLMLLVETPLLMLVFGLMRWRWSRKRYWFWLALGMAPLMVLGAFLLPQIVEPMFNTFEPLTKSHSALVEQLERVVARTGTSIPPERMFLMKASEKSNGLNAYVSGLGSTKRIVVWDTTADRMPVDEILFTFAHESGHYVLHHIAKGLTLAAMGTFALFWVTAGVADWLAQRFGEHWKINELASLPGLAVLLLAFSLVQIISEPVESTVSRYFEHEADVYGQEAIHGLVADPQKTAVAAFNDLGQAYLDDPNPNPLIEFWSYDHPSIQTRANFAAHYDPWGAGRIPRFFQVIPWRMLERTAAAPI
jgi:STE24 endopeptidase